MHIALGRGQGRGTRGYTKQESTSNSQSNPSVAAYSAISINLDLDAATEAWFLQLRTNWNYLKRSPSIINTIIQRFDSAENPYEEALRLMYNCVDFKYAKPKSLSFLIMEEFKSWKMVHKERIAKFLRTDVKISAFNIVRQQTLFTLMKLVVNIYEITSERNLFLDIINHMIEEKHYKEACQSAALLGLHMHFGIEQFLLPLILQDKISLVEEFLTNSVEHQHKLVEFLDSLLGKNTSIKIVMEYYVLKYTVPEVKWDKLHYKPFRKLIARLKKIYCLPDELTPFLIKKQNEGALQFLIHRRYIENGIGEESFKEMVHEAVQGDEKLQQDLVIYVASHNDTSTALMFAHLYRVPKENWPFNVRLLCDNPDVDRHQQKSEHYSQDNCNKEMGPLRDKYYKLKMPVDSIYLIDTSDAFENFIEFTLQSITLVGIDCEWKPSFGSRKNELALMQLATRQAVYVLDVISIGRNAGFLWLRFGEMCFNNSDVLKLGFGFISDMAIIRQSIPYLHVQQKVGFLDLQHLWRNIEKNMKIKLPYEVDGGPVVVGGGTSLSSLVHRCLGLPLNKADQFSNWEKRPLRQSQLEYAALDAYCLIEAYDVLKECCEKINHPFDEICYGLMTNNSGRTHKTQTGSGGHKKSFYKKKQVQEEINPQPPTPHETSVKASEIRLVCDSMLQGLGKSLRKCGINTVILENNQDHMDCIKYYHDDHRFILTRGHIFNKLNGNVPPGFCFRITTDDCDEQLKQVLDYYKIVVTKDDVFSICQICNKGYFIKISRSTMNALDDSSRTKKLNFIPAGYEKNHYEYDEDDYDDEDDLIDEASGFSSEDNLDYCSSNRSRAATRKWDICSDEHVDVGLCQTRFGAHIQIESVPRNLLEKVDLFYVCESCGKVYWDGTHYDRVLSGKLREIVLH